MIIDNILRKYQDKYIQHGSDFLFRPLDALDFLEDVAAENIDVLGIDLWRPVIIDGKEHFVEDAPIFLTETDNPIQVARSFLANHVPSNIAFVSFVLDESG